MSDNDIFLDLFIRRMNVKEAQGVERPRIKIKRIVKDGKPSDTTTTGNFLPEREEWKIEREEWSKLKAELPERGIGKWDYIEDWDYEDKINRHIVLADFRTLVAVYVPQKEVPPLRKLAELPRWKGSPDVQRRRNQRMVKAWQEALEEFEIEPYKRNKLATPASALNETRPGRIPDLLIQKRKKIVRELMATPVDFQNSEKVGTLFKRLDTEQIPLPKWRGSLRSWQPKTWKELLEKPRSPEYLRRIAVLKRDLYPPRQG